MYVYTLMLYRSNTGAGNDDIIRRLLRNLEGADEVGSVALSWKNQTYMRCCKDVYWWLQDMVPQHVDPILPQDLHCTSISYSELVGFEE
jgi:hypothetical protein